MVAVGIQIPLPEGREHLVHGTPGHAVAQEILCHRPQPGQAQHQGAGAGGAGEAMLEAGHTTRLETQSPLLSAPPAAATMRSCPITLHIFEGFLPCFFLLALRSEFFQVKHSPDVFTILYIMFSVLSSPWLSFT